MDCFCILQILRWLKDYDAHRRLFLPPISPGVTLPEEILEAYENYQKALLSPPTKPAESALPSEAQIVVDSSVSVSQPKLPESSSSTEVLHRVGTPGPSMTALLSVPQLVVIDSLTGMGQDSLFSQPDVSSNDVSPVAAAIARHLGIDLSPEALLAQNRRGVAIVVHGPLMAGRSTQAKALGEYYGAPVINVDALLKESISTAATPAGRRARECCIQAAAQAVAAETQEAPSNASVPGKKTATKESTKEKEKEKEREKEGSVEPPPQFAQPPVPFQVEQLEGTPLEVSEKTLLPTALPDEVIVEILSQRLQHTDCKMGVVFDGVESLFTMSAASSVTLVLRAFKDRKFIFFVHLEMELEAIKARQEEIAQEQRRKEEEEELARRAAELCEQERIAALLELDEDDYEALGEAEKQEIEARRMEITRERRLKKQREREERERLEQECREEEERRLEEERLRKKGKLKEAVKAKVAPMKPPAIAALAGAALMSAVSRPGSAKLGNVSITASNASIASGTDTPSAKRRTRMSGKPSPMNEEQNEPQCLLNRQYSCYKSSLEAIEQLLEDWDRCSGVARPRPPPEPVEEHPQPTKSTTPRKGKGKSKETPSTSSEQEPPAVTVATEKPPEEESREGLGVPLVSVTGAQPASSITRQILEGGLPSVEEVGHTQAYMF